MKHKLIVTCILSCLLLPFGYAQQEEIPLAPKEYRRPDGYDPAPHRYPYSLFDMKEKFSDDLMLHAAREYLRITGVIEQGKYQAKGESLDQHQTPEWFADMKFGMFVDWNLWSLAGYATKMENEPVYPDWYEYRMVPGRPYKDKQPNLKPYHDKNWGADFGRGDFIPLFKARDYSPEKLTNLALEAGMKYVIPFARHFSGFCLWPSSYTHMDMGDRHGKDLIAPLVDQCKLKGLKFGFYYCTQDWEFPIIGDNGELLQRTWFRGNTNIGTGVPLSETSLPEAETWAAWEKLIPGKIPVKDYLKDYLIPQAAEFIDIYDPDILWYDGDWTTPVEELGTYEIAAYFYNQAEGRKEVAVNDRYGMVNGKTLRNIRGDIFTSEYGYGISKGYKTKLSHAWEENRGISQSFGFNWQDTEENVITSKELVDMLINIVARGGNLLLIVNLDGQGALPDIQEKRLTEIGQWLKVNGEGIYYTRPYSVIAENEIRYTRSKDERTVYAISLDWPGDRLELSTIKPADNSEIYLLGCNTSLNWEYKAGKTIIFIPEYLQDKEKRPCKHAYTFRIRQ